VLCAVTIPPADLRSLSLYYYVVCGRMCVICACLVFLSVGDLLMKHITNTQEHQTPQMTYTCGHILRNNTNSTNANQREG
jgi:hypothetical protein